MNENSIDIGVNERMVYWTQISGEKSKVLRLIVEEDEVENILHNLYKEHYLNHASDKLSTSEQTFSERYFGGLRASVEEWTFS